MADARDAVRLSLRLLSASRLIEREVDALMRTRFKSTIARFDFLSALERHGALTLGEAAQYLLVSNGNITGLVSRLKADGLIETREDEHDRRVQRVRLTPNGERVFKIMAKAHAECVSRLLSGLGMGEKQALMQLLDGARGVIRGALTKGATP